MFDHGLGRRVRHDPRSRQFPAATSASLVSTSHYRPDVLDQGALGSCTGNALVGCRNTRPTRNRRRLLTEDYAQAVYARATQLDPWPGDWPPTDTGSSGLAACAAAVEGGLIGRYEHAFGLDHTLAALVLRPVMVGVNWYVDMEYPDARGFVEPTGGIAGGHEFELHAINVRDGFVCAVNSWGTGWGVAGHFRLRFATLGRLLSEDGDCTVPV